MRDDPLECADRVGPAIRTSPIANFDIENSFRNHRRDHPVSGSTELDAYHETFLPCNLATPTLVRARELKLKHGCHERWVLHPDFRAARGDVQHRTPPGCESPVDCHPRFLIGPSAGRTRFSSEQCHDWKRARGGIVADPDNSILLAEATDTELAPYKSRPTDPSFDLIMFTGGDLHRRHRSDSRRDARR